MLRSNKTQLGILIDKVPSLANLAAGAMIFGQFLNESPFSWFIAGLGVAAWVFLIGCAIAVARGDNL
jgi:hypothetical protein